MISLRKMKIRQKLVLLLLVIGLIPTLVVSVIAYITISTQLTRKTEDQMTSLVIKQEQKINSLLQGKQEEALKLANRYDLQLALGDYLGGDTSKGETLNTILRNKMKEYAIVQAIHLSNMQDMVLASTVKGEQGKKLSAKDYYAKAGQRNSITIRQDQADNINKLYVATRVNVNQDDVGVLTLVFKLDDTLAAIQDYTGLETTGETLIAAKDEKGQAISLFPLRFHTNAALSVNLTNMQLFEHIDRTYTGVSDYRERQVIVSVRSVGSADWVIATKIDSAEALAPIAQLRNSLAGIFFVSSAAILIIALSFARFFTAPLLALTQKTRSIMQGDFRQRITVKSSDEVGALAAAFNKMTDELAQLYGGLEQKVNQRTQDLNLKVVELEDAKAKDDAILESIGDGMIVTDSEGRILLINEIAIELLGIEKTAVTIGRNIADYELYDDRDTRIQPNDSPLQAALRTGKKITQEVKSIQKGSVKRALGVTATPVLQQGRLIGAIQIIRDITKEKEIDRMKTEFISIASHQLRTPLSAIKWFSEMLISGDAGEMQPEQIEFTHNIADSTQRMIELVNSLLNISRIESGRIIVDPKPTDLKELVGGIINDLKGKTAEKEQQLTISVHNDLEKINLDPRLIRQVYLNLLTNAIKYTPQGGDISVFISRKGDEVISQVTDNGYGIPKIEQAKMFQKFFRATNIVKIETDGTGLGMYLIKAIIESSGGRIWFESEEGKGTTFWFSLPASGMKAKEGEVTID